MQCNTNGIGTQGIENGMEWKVKGLAKQQQNKWDRNTQNKYKNKKRENK